jgi:hypothetical protein
MLFIDQRINKYIRIFGLLLSFVFCIGWIPLAFLGWHSASNYVNDIFNNLAIEKTISPQQAEKMMFQIGAGLTVIRMATIWSIVAIVISIIYNIALLVKCTAMGDRHK